MPASSSPILSPWLIISIILQLQLMLALLSKAIHFQFEPSFTFTNLANIKLVTQSRSWYNDGQVPTFGGDYIALTPDPTDGNTSDYSNLGQIIYKDPVRFKFNHSVVSFNTSFVFKIITTSDYGESGNGMAFFISNFDHAPSHSDGARLGLLAPDDTTQGTALKFFAVEFDTFQTSFLDDPSASHIGIDINSLISLNSTDTSPNSSSSFYPELYLYNNYTFTAWIEYDSVRSLIQVWMTNSSSASVRPPQACVQFTQDLSSVFEDYMHVGFTATNMPQDVAMEGHNLFSWSFSSVSPNATAIGSSNVTHSSSTNTTAIHQKKPSSSHNLLTIIVVTALIILALIAFTIILFFNRKKRRERQNKFPPSTIGIHKRSSTIQLGSINQCSLNSC